MSDKRIAYIFPGQGAQYLGMGADICRTYPMAKHIFGQASDILGRDMCRLVFDGTEAELNLTVNTQVSLLTVETAIMEVLASEGIKPYTVAGFSLGEWTALVAAGCLDFDDALRLVDIRANAMQEAVPTGEGAMAAVMGKDIGGIEDICGRTGGYVVPSNLNCPGQVTVSGEIRAVDEILRICENEGVAAKRLPVSIPSHCKLMQPAAERIKQALYDVELRPASIPLIMNVTGKDESEPERIKEKLIEQLTHPVLFERSLKTMLKNNVGHFIEIGPGKTLTGFAKRTARAERQSVKCLRVENISTLRETLSAVQEAGA